MNTIISLIIASIICLLASCESKGFKTGKAELTNRPNMVDITTREVHMPDGEWTEIVIKQTLSYNSPMLVENIKTRLADSMQFRCLSYTDDHDNRNRHVRRTMIIHARSLQRGKEIVLTQKDFDFNPSIENWPPVSVLSSKE